MVLIKNCYCRRISSCPFRWSIAHHLPPRPSLPLIRVASTQLARLFYAQHARLASRTRCYWRWWMEENGREKASPFDGIKLYSTTEVGTTVCKIRCCVQMLLRRGGRSRRWSKQDKLLTTQRTPSLKIAFQFYSTRNIQLFNDINYWMAKIICVKLLNDWIIQLLRLLWPSYILGNSFKNLMITKSYICIIYNK